MVEVDLHKHTSGRGDFFLWKLLKKTRSQNEKPNSWSMQHNDA
jgi:hypothetical protein